MGLAKESGEENRTPINARLGKEGCATIFLLISVKISNYQLLTTQSSASGSLSVLGDIETLKCNWSGVSDSRSIFCQSFQKVRFACSAFLYLVKNLQFVPLAFFSDISGDDAIKEAILTH